MIQKTSVTLFQNEISIEFYRIDEIVRHEYPLPYIYLKINR